MALVLADRVQETTTTTGTGTLTLAGAVTGYQSFSTAIGNGNTTYYTISSVSGSEWEVGIGTYTSAGNTLSRDTVLSSSAGGTTKVTFSAGTKNVFVTYPAEKSVNEDASGNVGIGTSSPTARLTAKGGLTQVFNYSGAAASPSETFDWPFPALEVTSYGDFTSQTMLALTLPNDGGYYLGYSVWNFKLQQTASSTTSAGVSGCTFGGPGYLGFAPGGSERMRIDSSGNVGIGTSSPGNKLDIVGAGSSQIRVKDGVGATSYYDFGRDGTDGFFGFSGAQTTFSGYKWSVNAGTEVMRITNGGNVGIGTSSPAYRLDVRAAGTFTGDTQASIYDTRAVAADVGGGLNFGGNYTGTTVTTWASISGLKENATDGNFAGYLAFYTRPNGSGATEKFRIASNGAWGLSGANYGTSGQVLTSNGSGSAPTWQTPAMTQAKATALSMILGF